MASLTSVEVNFTLKNAFWSSQIARKSSADVDAIFAGCEADAGVWIAGTGHMMMSVSPSSFRATC